MTRLTLGAQRTSIEFKAKGVQANENAHGQGMQGTYVLYTAVVVWKERRTHTKVHARPNNLRDFMSCPSFAPPPTPH